MVDLVKCPGTNCLKKDNCVRFLKPARPFWQAYLTMEISIPVVSSCRFHMPVETDEPEPQG